MTGFRFWHVGASMAGGAVVALASWFILHQASLPAFNTSMVLRASSTAFSMLILLVTALVLWKVRSSIVRNVVASLAPAALVVSALAIPLSATRLYLDGIQVDQGFRTQFLSRMTETASNHDMNYFGLPTFYPIGWFWLGGRLANLLHMQGWEVYQPWALISLAAAAAALTPVWKALTGSLPLASVIALVTTAVVLTETPDEPYAAVVAMFMPAAVIVATRALRGSWKATVALAVYLGVSATFYTLYTALTALAVTVLAVVFALSPKRSFTPMKHLIVIGASSILIALISWGPYLYTLAFGEYEARSTANHFLPAIGTQFPLPFFSASVVALLSLVGLVYLCVRIRTPEALSLAVGVGVCFFWVLLSMITPLVGTTLLGFRVEVLVLLLFSTAGVIACSQARLVFGEVRQPVATAAGIVVIAAGVFYVQQIPAQNESHINQAYSDTDGTGERADRFPPDAGRYYSDVRAFIQDHGYQTSDTVVQTDEINFMAMNPFYGFNAFTSHYANPLGEYELRMQQLMSWAEGSYDVLADPDAMSESLDSAQWRAPDVFIFRGDLDEPDEPLTTHVALDIFPNEPNVRYQRLSFNQASFDSPAWDQEQIGPFVVVVRNR